MNIREIKAKNKEAGQHFFEKETLRFFNSTVFPKVFGDGYFVTSERQDLDRPLRFTVRKAEPNGDIQTVKCGNAFSGFQVFETYAEAIEQAKKLAQTSEAHPEEAPEPTNPLSDIFAPTLDLLKANDNRGATGNGYDKRHNAALLNPTPNEKRILDLFVSWANYARGYLEEFETHIGNDYVARPAFQSIGRGLQDFLNYDLGRLDGGTLSAFLHNFATLHNAPLED